MSARVSSVPRTHDRSSASTCVSMYSNCLRTPARAWFGEVSLLLTEKEMVVYTHSWPRGVYILFLKTLHSIISASPDIRSDRIEAYPSRELGAVFKEPRILHQRQTTRDTPHRIRKHLGAPRSKLDGQRRSRVKSVCGETALEFPQDQVRVAVHVIADGEQWDAAIRDP